MIFNGKKKAVTFSFDDGINNDIRLIELLDKYGLKSTFNISSGILTSVNRYKTENGNKSYRLNYFDYPNLYDDHEIAAHGYTHAHASKLDAATIYNEVALDKKLLEFLYSREVRGMAYPYGAYNDTVFEALKKCGLEYGRTVNSTYGFSLPENPLEWNPTCHILDEKLLGLADEFLNISENALFYIWGHSYELETEEQWQSFEELCKRIANRNDVFYGTNIEILDLINKN